MAEVTRTLGEIASKVRSKNAGPFWLTIDIFCADDTSYQQVIKGLDNPAVAQLFGVDHQSLKRFDIPDLRVVKYSVPRPVVQGMRNDRDMHGAAWACLLEEMKVPLF